jgi:hypothetical protein
MEFYVLLVYFMALVWYIFPRIGIVCLEISGNPNW